MERHKVGGSMFDRREFLISFAGAAALGSSANFPAVCKDMLGQAPDKLPDHALYDKDEEGYWNEIRKQFLIPEDEVYLNNGTVGSSPVPVLSAVFDGYRDSERLAQPDPEDYPIWGYAKWNQFRDPLAQFVGCTRDGTQRYGSEQLHRQWSRSESRRRGVDDGSGTSRRGTPVEPSRQAIWH